MARVPFETRPRQVMDFLSLYIDLRYKKQLPDKND